MFSRNLDGVSFVRKDGVRSGFPLDWRQGDWRDRADRLATDTLRSCKGDVQSLDLRPTPLQMETESKAKRSSLPYTFRTTFVGSRAPTEAGKDGCDRRFASEVWLISNFLAWLTSGLNTKTGSFASMLALITFTNSPMVKGRWLDCI